MAARLIKQNGHELTIQVTVNISGSLLEAEESVQRAVNEAGCLATQPALKPFDTDGWAIITGGVKWTKRASNLKKYQTPYGEIELERHV